MSSFRAVVIRPNEAAQAVTIERGLEPLQEIVGGMIEALPMPDWRMDGQTDRADATCYVNEEGKFVCVDENGVPKINMTGTIFMLPNLWKGDYIVGPLILCGFNPAKGENEDLPDDLYELFRLEVPA